jgi:hypothetical protein
MEEKISAETGPETVNGPQRQVNSEWYTCAINKYIQGYIHMKKIVFLILTTLLTGIAGMAFAGGDGGLAPFHSVIVSSEIEAELIESDSAAIELKFSNADRESLIAEVTDSVLRIRMKTGNYKEASLGVKVFFNRDLKMLQASGRAKVSAHTPLNTGGDMAVKLSNGGEMRLELHCDSLNANLSQGSIFHVSGDARTMIVSVSSGATFSGYEFSTEHANVSAGSAAKAKISVSTYLDAKAVSGGFIGYVGDPEIIQQKASLRGEIVKTILE